MECFKNHEQIHKASLSVNLPGEWLKMRKEIIDIQSFDWKIWWIGLQDNNRVLVPGCLKFQK